MGLGSVIKKFFFLPSEQKAMSRGSHLEETPESAIFNVCPFHGAQELIYIDDKWYKRDHGVPNEGELSYTPVADAEVTGGVYVPPFKVSGVTVDAYPQTADPATTGYLLNYDSPSAWNLQDRMFAGQHYPRNITRVRLGAGTTATKITLHRN